MTTGPLAILVTRPDGDTVATAVSDDDHAALLVTSATAPFDRVSVAVNCDVDPTAGAAPVTVTLVRDVGATDEPPHAVADKPTARAQSRRTNDWIFMMMNDSFTGVRPGNLWRDGHETAINS